jgi:hypothetical protein
MLLTSTRALSETNHHTFTMAALASAPIGLSYSIKVPVHTHSKVNAPPVAARLRARDFPARSPTTPQV